MPGVTRPSFLCLPACRYPQVKAEMVAAGVQAPEFGQISAKCSEQWGKLAGAAKAKFVDDAAAERMRLEAVW